MPVELLGEVGVALGLTEHEADELGGRVLAGPGGNSYFWSVANASTATYAGNPRNSEEYALLNDIAWYARNTSMKTMDVGLKKPNTWGLYDMHGNVAEWTADGYDAKWYDSLAGTCAPNPCRS